MATLKSLLNACSSDELNELSEVESAAVRVQELPLTTSHALLEACRTSNQSIVAMLLERADLDVNQPATQLQLTAFADACGRGDVPIARLLLRDSRVDPTRGYSVRPPPS